MTLNAAAAVDRSIYPMPMFASLVVRDFEATARLYAAAGFVTLATIPGPDGPQLLHLRRMKYQDILATLGDPIPGSTSISFAAGNEDLSALADKLRCAGAVVRGPIDTPWFTTDLGFTDTDGNQVIFTTPRMADQAMARAWARNGGIDGDFIAKDDSGPW